MTNYQKVKVCDTKNFIASLDKLSSSAELYLLSMIKNQYSSESSVDSAVQIFLQKFFDARMTEQHISNDPKNLNLNANMKEFERYVSYNILVLKLLDSCKEGFDSENLNLYTNTKKFEQFEEFDSENNANIKALNMEIAEKLCNLLKDCTFES